MSGKDDGSRQKVRSFAKEIEQGTMNFTDEEFTRKTVRGESRPRRGACDCCVDRYSTTLQPPTA